jgi:hypothetical protein
MSFEILKTNSVENAETYRDEVRAGKRPAMYTKKQFFEELEEAKKNGPIRVVFFHEIRNDLVLATMPVNVDKLDAYLDKLDENMLFTDDPEFVFAKKAKIK